VVTEIERRTGVVAVRKRRTNRLAPGARLCYAFHNFRHANGGVQTQNKNRFYILAMPFCCPAQKRNRCNCLADFTSRSRGVTFGQDVGVVERVERCVAGLEQDGFYQFERVFAVAFRGGDEREVGRQRLSPAEGLAQRPQRVSGLASLRLGEKSVGCGVTLDEAGNRGT